MSVRLTPLRVRLALLCTLGSLSGLAFVQGRADEPAKKPADKSEKVKAAWTSDEALAQLRDYPRDPYLQYVAMQMARREKAGDVAYQQVEQLLAAEGRRERREGRLDNVDLFSVFTGALAVQESLQLDTMRGPARNQPRLPDDELREKRKKEIVDIAKIAGPTIKSHPWEKMLGDKKPDIEPLAKMVPDDYFFVEFRSVSKLLELADSGDLWTMHLSHQASKDARSQQIGERLRKQLVIESNKVLRPLYDTVVEDVALTGSDLFFGEGSDVTMIFRLKKPDLFKSRMEGFITKAEKERKDAKKTNDEYLGVKYEHLTTPERDLHVFSAYPEANIHVRSNSKAAFFRVLEAIKGKTPDGKAVTRLGDTTEFAYIRTLMPHNAKEEDGFIYLSDPFIHHIVGPQLKLTERRRMLCYNHLRMIGHAALLYRTEHGKPPASLDDLVKADCCPGAFNDGDLRCIDSGKYTLSADGMQGVCSHHGHCQHLTPCCDNPMVWASGLEADEYKQFLDEYNRYWQTFFDPIAIRVQVTPERYRLETIVLPLINNSIYQGMAKALGGKPEPLDALPVPKRNIFSIQARFDKKALMNDDLFFKDAVAGEKEMRLKLARDLGIPEKDAEALDLVKFVTKGLGNQVGLHVYDAPPMFDLNTPQLLGLMLGTFNGNNRQPGFEEIWISFLITSLNSPAYIALPVQDEKIVDDFLDQLDKVLPPLAKQRENLGFIRFEQDFYKTKLKNKEETLMRCYSFSIGPVKWRMFWARIGGGLYIASKPFILEDLVGANAERAEVKDKPAPDPETTAHAMIRLRSKNWNQVLDDYKLGWAENNRQACINNLGPLSSAGRAVVRAEKSPEAAGKEAQQLADQLYAVHFFCPEGGKYLLSPDGKTCSCSVHGTARDPRQNVAPNDAAGPGKVLQEFGGLTATLTFLEDGLHAVIVIDRK
jgi:hypothetical protein